MLVSLQDDILQRAAPPPVWNICHVKTYTFIFLDNLVRYLPGPVEKEDVAGVEHTDCLQTKLLGVPDEVPSSGILADSLIKDPMVPWLVACH